MDEAPDKHWLVRLCETVSCNERLKQKISTSHHPKEKTLQGKGCFSLKKKWTDGNDFLIQLGIEAL